MPGETVANREKKWTKVDAYSTQIAHIDECALTRKLPGVLRRMQDCGRSKDFYERDLVVVGTCKGVDFLQNLDRSNESRHS